MEARRPAGRRTPGLVLTIPGARDSTLAKRGWSAPRAPLLVRRCGDTIGDRAAVITTLVASLPGRGQEAHMSLPVARRNTRTIHRVVPRSRGKGMP